MRVEADNTLGEATTMEVVSEAGALLHLAWPSYLATVCEVGLSTTAAIFIGQTGDPVLIGGVFLAISMFNILVSAPVVGLSAGLETLSSQAFGAREYRKVGVYLQRGLAVSMMYALLVLPVLGFPQVLLRFLVSSHSGQSNEDVIAVATDYLRFYAIGLIPLVAFDSLRRYLVAQHIVDPMMWSSFASFLTNMVLHAILVSWLGLGARGSGLSMSLSSVVNLAVLLALTVRGGLHQKTWHGWTLEAFDDLRAYLSLSLPGVLQICAEWWSFEVTIFVIARCGKTTLAAHAALMNITFLNYIAPMSVGTAAAVRVGNALGSGSAHAARLSALVALLMACATAAIEVTVILSLRDFWPRVYTSNDEIISLMQRTAWVFALFCVSDNMQAVIGGILKGSGNQVLGAYGNVIMFWIVGLPFGILLSLSSPTAVGALRGMWGAVAMAEWILVAVVVVIICRTDWNRQVQRALVLLGKYEPIL